MSTTNPDSNNVNNLPARPRRDRQCRKGAIILLFLALLVPFLMLIALGIDSAVIMLTRTQVQNGVDAASLAAAGTLANGEYDEVAAVARDYVRRNTVFGGDIPNEDIQIELGNWDTDRREFSVTDDDFTAVRITSRANQRPTFFSRVAGFQDFSTGSSAVATFRPRDIILVLDCSGSMNDDSEFRQIDTLGRDAVVANQRQIYDELGSPTFGLMQWTPVYISSGSTSTVQTALGLDDVPYPYPGGSWNEYINYVKTDGTVQSAGYRKKYGYLTLVQYWLNKEEAYNETPDLWMTSEQPITAVKDAISIFLSYIGEVKCDDRVGLSVYTYSNSGALLATPLTRDLEQVEFDTRRHQAGHYMPYTNIGAGLKKSREELEDNSRTNSLKLIVLLTDGLANRPTTGAYGLVRSEANHCANNGFPVVTISLGANVDQTLMQEVADTTKGVHFNIPGGQAVEDYEEDLKDVFRRIAADRELMLVQ